MRRWGADGAPRLFVLHGWMDVGASFQFVVDALEGEWQVIAPDWRGFGESEWTGRPYWFPDYLADLDALLARYSSDEPARLVGASM
ncbi:MAG: putative methyl ester carboxylesterase, partial [Proteobacteria bacterium]|nr:putative methyl ester carboxylesterase [Pseudomonadota bacterium]